MGLSRDAAILIVDNLSSSAGMVRKILSDLGYTNLIETVGGQEAFNKIKSKKIDLIVSDWKISDMSGMELLEEVKQDEELKEIPFLMVLPKTQDEEIIMAVQAGVNSYILKPVTAQGLEEKIKRMYNS